MAQYRSRWTGEEIDDAVDKVRKIAYINLNGNPQEAYEAAEAAYSAGFDIVARYDRNMGVGTLIQSFELLCVLRQQTKNSSQQTSTYYWFRSFVTHTSLKLAFKLGCDYGSTTAILEDVTATYQWEATQETLGIQEQSNDDIAEHDIPEGSYVYFKAGIAKAITNIAVGDTLRAVSPNRNLAWISNGGLNDLKSAISKVAVRPNLLRNWYFVGGGSQQFPINQRGQTTYSGAVYGVDGWRNYQPYVTTTITSAGLSISRSSGNFYSITQTVDNVSALAGKKVMASMLATGYNRIRLVADGTSILDSGDGNIGNEFNYATVTLPSNLSTLLFIAYSSTNVATVVKAVKLELGDTQTLCHNEGTDANPVWVLNEIPDYATELAKCQRYLYVINPTAYASVGFGVAASTTFFRGLIPTPVTMRAHPTITCTTSDIRLVGNGEKISLAGKTFGTDQIFPNGVPFYCANLTGLTESALYVLEAYNGSIILSAET